MFVTSHECNKKGLFTLEGFPNCILVSLSKHRVPIVNGDGDNDKNDVGLAWHLWDAVGGGPEDRGRHLV